MRQHQAIILFLSFLALMGLACNAFVGEPEPSLSLPPTAVNETATPQQLPGLGTLAPTATLPGAGLPPVDDGSPVATVLVDLNVRSGPSVNYPRVGFLSAGSSVPIIGRSAETGWWKIECPPQIEGDSCWISGGTQYSQARNASDVATVAAPPTPTPARAATSGMVAYSDGRGVWLLTLNGDDPPTAVDAPRQLSTAVSDALAFSPDGRYLAYLVDTYPTNELHVVNLADGDGRVLVNGDALPPPPAGTAAFIWQMAWVADSQQADSQQIAFNTGIINLEGPGVGSREDLWTVTVDGGVTPRLAEGEGGGAFAISPQNQVLMSQSDRVILAALDGSAPTTVINFEMINTASEYIYYPQPHWLNDGLNARLAIPDAEPFGDDPITTLWQVDSAGTATAVNDIPGNILFDPPQWTAVGDHLAYVKTTFDVPPQLTLADGSGNAPVNYDSDQQLQFYSWSPDGQHFLYRRQSSGRIGQLNGGAQSLNLNSVAGDWLNESAFILMVQLNSNQWTLHSGNLTGTTAELISPTTHDYAPPLAVWP